MIIELLKNHGGMNTWFIEIKKKLCITLLKINFNKSTSLHCHPKKKKSGFMLLEGKANFQLGLWKKKTEKHNSPSKRMIARGLFHSIRAVSKKWTYSTRI